MQAVLSHILQLQRQIDESREEILSQIYEYQHHHLKQLEILNKNIKRIALQPVLRSRALLEQASRTLKVEMVEDAEDGAEGCTSRVIPRPIVHF